MRNEFENAHLRYVIAVLDNTHIQVLCFIRNFLSEIDKIKFKNIRFEVFFKFVYGRFFTMEFANRVRKTSDR